MKNNDNKNDKINNDNHKMITIIIPTYNRKKKLAKCLEALSKQSYSNYEIIVVDDGSTDSSKDIIKTYGKRLRLFEQTNKGPYPARNLGIHHSTGEFIAFLDADDYWTPDCIEKLYNALNPSNAALAYCGWQNVGIPGKTSEPYIPPENKYQKSYIMFIWDFLKEISNMILFEQMDLSISLDIDDWS